MNLISIREAFVDPNEVVSIEKEIVHKNGSSRPSGYYAVETFNGVRIILKNGHKVFVDKITPDEVITLLKGSSDETVEK